MKILCILVLYNPDRQLLDKVIRAIEGQVDSIFVADNTPKPYICPENYSSKIVYYNMQGNKGIAAAQNQGIKYAMEQGFDFVLYLDQDSIVQQDMVRSMTMNYKRLHSGGICVGAVGPRPVNRQSDRKYTGNIKQGIPIMDGISEVGELISSASLVPTKAFVEVGLMEEGLFIDGVDFEWCWRARKKGGYRFFICENTLLSHCLGEGDRYFIIRKIAIPSPFRTYYQFRNFLWLSRRDYVPMSWKVSNSLKFSIKIFYYPLFVPPRKQYLENILKGIKNGLFGG